MRGMNMRSVREGWPLRESERRNSEPSGEAPSSRPSPRVRGEGVVERERTAKPACDETLGCGINATWFRKGIAAMNAPLTSHPTPPYKHTPLFPLGKDQTPYRKISADGIRVERVMGEEVLVVPREAMRALAEAAFTDINHLLRPAHLASLKHIVEDPEASDNDKFVAYDFLKNANIAAGGILPMCQDTGTAIIMGKKGRLIWTDGGDEAALAEGARDAYLKRNLRYSQLAPISMFEEKNTRSNMPAQVELYAEGQILIMPSMTPPTSFCSSPRAAARPTSRFCSRARRRSCRANGCCRS